MPTIVFDLDGTLIDTAPDLIGTLNVILAREGLPAVPYETARSMIGGGARGMIERGLAAEGRGASKPEVDRLFAAFIEHYAAHIADGSRPFPQLNSALDRLATDGFRLAVCTNKLEWLAVRLLDALGLSSRFAAICGQDTFGVQKPDPEMLRRTIARAGGDPANGGHGRRLRHRHPGRACRRSSRHRGRFRLQRRADRELGARSDHQFV